MPKSIGQCGEYAHVPVALPSLQIGVFFCLFLAVIAYNRMEFTITRDDKWAAARDREALATTMEQIAALLEGESASGG